MRKMIDPFRRPRETYIARLVAPAKPQAVDSHPFSIAAMISSVSFSDVYTFCTSS